MACRYLRTDRRSSMHLDTIRKMTCIRSVETLRVLVITFFFFYYTHALRHHPYIPAAIPPRSNNFVT